MQKPKQTLEHRAMLETQRTGKTTVTCPKCRKNPTANLMEKNKI